MLYHLYELTHAAVAPMRAAAHFNRLALTNPANPWSYGFPAKAASAAIEVFEGLTRRYGKPEFGIDSVSIAGRSVAVTEEDVLEDDFCTLKRMRRDADALPRQERDAPRLLIVAPLSGHYATLLRGTVLMELSFRPPAS